MADRRYFIDIFDEMMVQIQALYDTTNQEEPYAIFGDKNEVITILKEKDENSEYKFKKYPLLILYRGFSEPRGGINQSFEFTASPLISIVTNSCLLYTSPSPRDVEESRMPSSA